MLASKFTELGLRYCGSSENDEVCLGVIRATEGATLCLPVVSAADVAMRAVAAS